MGDPASIKRRYQQFAETECKGYSDLYYRLALAVSEDDEVVRFIAEMPVTQPNLFFASIQRRTGPAGMPATGSDLRAFVRVRGDEVRDVMRYATDPDQRSRALCRAAAGFAVRTPGARRGWCKRFLPPCHTSCGDGALMSVRSMYTTTMRSGGCWHASGRSITNGDDASKAQSIWPGPTLPLSAPATSSRICRRCSPRYRTMPSSSCSTSPC